MRVSSYICMRCFCLDILIEGRPPLDVMIRVEVNITGIKYFIKRIHIHTYMSTD